MTEIPEFLSHLPVFHGMPVPFTVLWVNEVPDFRVTDNAKLVRCLHEFLCGICGTTLGSYVWFVAGPLSLTESGIFSDPPMHEQCARYAVSVCPYLSGKTNTYNEARIVTAPEHMVIVHDELMVLERPEKIGMRRARRSAYRPMRHNQSLMIHVERWYGQPIWLA